MKSKGTRSIKLLLSSLMLCMAVVFTVSGISVDAAKVSLSKKSVSIYKGKTYRLTLKNVVKGKKITWKTSKKSVASIKADGASCTITGKKAGSATVSAKVGKKTYKCKVKVKNLPVSLSASKKTVTAGTSFTLQLNNTSSNAKWSVSSKKILSIKKLGKNRYKVSGLKAGNAKVYAKIGKKKYTCAVTVKAKPVSIAKAPSCVARQTVYGEGGYSIDDAGKKHFIIESFDVPNMFIFIKNLDKNAKVTDIKSSNPSIRAYKDSRGDMLTLRCNSSYDSEGNPVSPVYLNATSTISFKVIQNKKTYNLSCRITVKMAESPFSSFKIGSREYANDYKGNLDVDEDIKNIGSGRHKISIKMAPGYVLDRIGVYINLSSGGQGEYKVIKNGSTVDFSNDVTIAVDYHRTGKPVNYVRPAKGDFPLYSFKYFNVSSDDFSDDNFGDDLEDE